MSEQQTAEQRALPRCVECNAPVNVPDELIGQAFFICKECEQKQDDAFWEAIHG